MSLGQNVNEYFQHRVWASSEAEAREKAKTLAEKKFGRKAEIGFCREVITPGWWEFWANLKPFDMPL